MKRHEWIILLALALACIVTAGLGDLLRFHLMTEAAGHYKLISIGFFATAVLWVMACALRITNEERA